MNRLGIFFFALFLSCNLGQPMASESYPVEDSDVVNERIRAHTREYLGTAIPEVHANYYAAREVHQRLLQRRLQGVSAAGEQLLRQNLLDTFDIDAIASAASANLDSETVDQTKVITLDYASLALDVPNYVRMLMERYVEGPSDAERAAAQAKSAQTSSSGTLSIRSQ